MAQRKRTRQVNGGLSDPVKLGLVGGAVLLLYQIFAGNPAMVNAGIQALGSCCGK